METEEPPDRCFPGRCCAAWGGYGAAWAAWGAPSNCPRTIAPATGPFGFSRNTRHESRITNHGFFSKHGFFPRRQTVDVRRRQVRRLQGGMYEAVRKRVERGLSESREKNNDFFRIPTRFTTRYIPLFPTMTRKDSDKPLLPIKRLCARRPVAAFLRVVALHGRLWCGMGGILPPRRRPCPVSRSRSALAASVAHQAAPVARRAAPAAANANRTHAEKGERYSLHFLPRGEKKCVRGPLGRGASRAEEKARATWSLRFFTNHESRNTNHGLCSRASADRW